MSRIERSHESDSEIASLRARLAEAEETLRAIRGGEVDALVVSGKEGERVYTLESAELPYRILVERMQEGAVTLAQDGVILYCNLRFSEMLGAPLARLAATKIQDYVWVESAGAFERLLNAGAMETARGEVRFTADGNKLVPAFVAVSPLPPEVEGCICLVVTDLTEQESMRESNAEIEHLNEQLKRAVRETHHRVKNNLQTIAGIADMTILEGSDQVPIAEFRRLALYTRSLAAVHDLLSRDSDEDTQLITCRAILEKLVELISCTVPGHTFIQDLHDVNLTAKQGNSLAIVMSEIITNAVKHGAGRITISMFENDGLAVCEVRDNGQGFPDGFDVRRDASLGLDLVEQITRWDLAGTVTYRNLPEGGASVQLQMRTAD